MNRLIFFGEYFPFFNFIIIISCCIFSTGTINVRVRPAPANISQKFQREKIYKKAEKK